MNADSSDHRGVVVGHGLDIVDIPDFSRLLKISTEPLLKRYFTESELIAAGGGATQVEKLAGRFAVKEAVLKALKVGWGDGIAFVDVEVVTLDNGAPAVALHRSVAELADKRGVANWLISTSHTSSTAIASVIAIGA